MLKKIAEIFETDVSKLLGSSIEKDASIDMVAEQYTEKVIEE